MAEIEESSGAFSRKQVYEFSQVQEVSAERKFAIRRIVDPNVDSEDPQDSSCCTAAFKSTKNLLADIFLPYQYPLSVTTDYLSYQIWNMLQGLVGTISSTMATEALYKALGVGQAGASALAATTVMLLRDGSGHLGEIVFAWAKGRAFDYDNKKWRFFADFGYNIVIGLTLTFPMYPPEYRIYAFCGTALIQACQSIAGASTRVGLISHQALMKNSSDVKAKDNSQERLMNFVGLSVSLTLLYVFSGTDLGVWVVFASCVLLHISCNYFAVKSLQFRSLNRARLLICLHHYLKWGLIPSLKQVNRMESIVLGFGISDTDVCRFHVRVGVKIKKAFKFNKHKKETSTGISVKNLLSHFEGKRFLVIVRMDKSRIDIIVHEDVTPVQMIEAYVRAVLVAHRFTTEQIELDVLDPAISEHWYLFRQQLQNAGFDLDQDQLGGGVYRAAWKLLT